MSVPPGHERKVVEEWHGECNMTVFTCKAFEMRACSPSVRLCMSCAHHGEVFLPTLPPLRSALMDALPSYAAPWQRPSEAWGPVPQGRHSRGICRACRPRLSRTGIGHSAADLLVLPWALGEARG